MLAGVLAIVGALAAGYYFAMRPVTLRIAVGPGQQRRPQGGPDADAGLQQPDEQPGPVAPDADRRRGGERRRLLGEGKADLAIIRGDLDVPKNAQAVATLRKNVAVLWVPPAGKVKGKKAAPEDHQDRAARRTSHRRRRPHRRPTSICSR